MESLEACEDEEEDEEVVDVGSDESVLFASMKTPPFIVQQSGVSVQQ